MIGYRSTRSALLTALVLMGLLAAPAQAQNRTPGLFALAQVIHNIPDVGPVDIYVDNVRIIDDLTFQTATGFMPLLCPNSCKHKIDLVLGDEADNSSPVFSEDFTFTADQRYAGMALGVLSEGEFALLTLNELRTQARAPGKVEYLLIHGVPGAEVDILLLDEDGECNPTDPATCFLLVNNFEFGDYVGYWQLAPRMNYFRVNTADGRTTLATLGFDVSAYEDETITVLASPLGGGDFTLVGFDADGNKLEAVPVAAPRAVDVPGTKALAVKGNYPNPFNPATSIRFDLTEPAAVQLEVIDVLGRTVMTRPAQRFEAGAGHTVTVDASSLASGIYLYRVIAQTNARTLTHTGRMILSK